jgi:hypothetical protein
VLRGSAVGINRAGSVTLARLWPKPIGNGAVYKLEGENEGKGSLSTLFTAPAC